MRLIVQKGLSLNKNSQGRSEIAMTALYENKNIKSANGFKMKLNVYTGYVITISV